MESIIVGQSAGKFCCDQCSTKFKMLQHLETHDRRVHEKVRNYNCHYDGCENSFFPKT